VSDVALMWLSVGSTLVGVAIVWIYTVIRRWVFRRQLDERSRVRAEAIERDHEQRMAALGARIHRDMARHFAEYPLET
jgi:heme exporter protein D